jgi:hypothetical protein
VINVAMFPFLPVPAVDVYLSTVVNFFAYPLGVVVLRIILGYLKQTSVAFPRNDKTSGKRHMQLREPSQRHIPELSPEDPSTHDSYGLSCM